MSEFIYSTMLMHTLWFYVRTYIHVGTAAIFLATQYISFSAPLIYDFLRQADQCYVIRCTLMLYENAVRTYVKIVTFDKHSHICCLQRTNNKLYVQSRQVTSRSIIQLNIIPHVSLHYLYYYLTKYNFSLLSLYHHIYCYIPLVCSI